MKKTRKVYWVEFKHNHHLSQYLTLSEFFLIKGMLTEGRVITKLEKVTLTDEQYRNEFGL